MSRLGPFEENTIIVGDCLDIMAQMPDESFHLIILDPPYLTTQECWDGKETITDAFVQECYRILWDKGSIYIWCGIGEKSQSLIRWFPLFDRYFIFKDLITWKKARGMGHRRGWLYTREECMWFTKGQEYIWNKEYQYLEGIRRKRDKYGIKVGQNGKLPRSPFKRITNIWDDFTELDTETMNLPFDHYTPKPPKAIKRVILAHTEEGDFVGDFFIGSGTTAVVADRLGRKFFGCDINPDYVKMALERLEKDRAARQMENNL